jgi:hypothetical protein
VKLRRKKSQYISCIPFLTVKNIAKAKKETAAGIKSKSQFVENHSVLFALCYKMWPDVAVT